MGLSGRKAKQRIPNDPRNLSWADDAARFGSNYLAKFGWNSSQGLGAQGDGRTSHIKVAQKLDMLGIGAAQQRDPNGIAWKQNQDFESLLRRLNGQTTAPSGFSAEGSAVANEVEVKDEDGEDEKLKKKKDKKDKKRKEKEHKIKEEEEVEETPEAPKDAVSTKVEENLVQVKSTTATTTTRVIPRHRSHRAKHMRAKNLSSKSSAHISEILGIAPTPSTSTSGLTSGADTPLEEVAPDDQIGLEKITTATKSVADYFKEKLRIKAGSSPSPSPAVSYDLSDDADERPRMGIGSSRLSMFAQAKVEEVEETTVARGGIGASKFSSMFSSSFMAASSSTSMIVEEESKPNVTHTAEVKVKEEPVAVDTPKEKKKKRKHRNEDDSAAEVEKVETVEEAEGKDSPKKKRKKGRVDPEEVEEESSGRKSKKKKKETESSEAAAESNESKTDKKKKRKNKERSD